MRGRPGAEKGENRLSKLEARCRKRTKTVENPPDGQKNVENFCIYPLTFGE